MKSWRLKVPAFALSSGDKNFVYAAPFRAATIQDVNPSRESALD